MNTKGLLYPSPCPHCGKENTKKGCYEFFGKQNGRKYGVCMRGASPATGWEQAYESDGKTLRGDRAGNSVYQEIIPYEQNGGKKNTNKKLEDTYYYPDKADNPLIKIDCYRDEDGEKYPYAYRYTSNGEWKPGYKDYIARSDIPIYRYGNIRSSIESGHTIWIVEGEKCVERLWKMGIFATCNIGGADTSGNKWKPSDTACLDGAKEIILCPDQDQPGILHMEAIYKQLLEYGFSDSSIKWLYVYPDSQEWDNIPKAHGLDIFDWIEDGATYQQILASVQDTKRDIIIQSNRAYIDANRNQDLQNQLNYILYDQDGKAVRITKNILIAILKIIYGERLRFNLQTLEPWLDDKPFKEVEGDLDHLDVKLADTYGLEVNDVKARSTLLYLAKQNKFHPVEDYLKRVAIEVEPIDLDNLATRYFGIEDELANTYLKLWVLAAVGRAIYPGCYVRNVLILQGKPDLGKSTFFRLLGSEHFSDSLGDCKDKDQKMIAHRKWIHEWAEFEKLWRRALRSEVKGFITATEDTFRVPYGRTTDTFKRRFILCGTSNEEQFLKDPTGNDRFWIISIKQEINLEQLAKDRDAIWSAAARIILNANPDDVMTGKLWKLPEHLLEANRKNTAKYEEIHPWEHLLQEVIDSWGNTGWIRADKLWEALDIEVKEQGKNSNTFSDIMRKLGWKKGGVKKIKEQEGWKTYRTWIPIDSD